MNIEDESVLEDDRKFHQFTIEEKKEWMENIFQHTGYDIRHMSMHCCHFKSAEDYEAVIYMQEMINRYNSEHGTHLEIDHSITEEQVEVYEKEEYPTVLRTLLTGYVIEAKSKLNNK